LNEVGAPPAPGAVGDNVGRVGDERRVVCVELAHVVTGTVVVRVTGRRQRTVDHALQMTIHLKGVRHFVDHPATAVIIPLPASTQTYKTSLLNLGVINNRLFFITKIQKFHSTKLIFLIFSDVWFDCLVDLYIDCFHNNCLLCYIYYDLISHPWQHSSIPLVV